MLKLHLGNGTVYLKGYTNIDLTGVLAIDFPEMAKHNATTVEKYYKFPFRHNKDSKVTDVHMDMRRLLFNDGSVDEILTVNTIDHLKKEDFLTALKEWKRVLRPGGRLIIDVDDRKKQAELFASAQTMEEIEWGLRLLYCDHAAEGRTHLWGYTPAYLAGILEAAGFIVEWIRDDYIVHDTTRNFQICAIK